MKGFAYYTFTTTAPEDIPSIQLFRVMVSNAIGSTGATAVYYRVYWLTTGAGTFHDGIKVFYPVG
ncbi:hypothetical protein [Pontibacter beigongshangensis]|uniref:hypothetical protein n=1 Tax=Pontibacter beigongshangensis TaxID=2574733 RepID=UPI0016503412|nr:hypothetical protein [Pontibacter beigongshangensis]